MKKSIILLSSVLMLLTAFTGCAKKTEKGEFTVEKGKLKIAMEIGYPPFEYFEKDGRTPAGFDVELGKELAKRLDLEPVFIDTVWDGILAGLDTNRYDVILSAMTVTDERKQNYDFANVYIGNGQSICLRSDSKYNITSPENLVGRRVGYQAETTSDFFLEKRKEKGLSFIAAEYDKVLNAFDDLKLGRVDAVVSDYLVSVSYLNKPDTVYKCVWVGTADEYFGPCVKKGNTVLIEKINAALEEMKADGTLKSIYEKIFGMDLSHTIENVQ